MKVVFISHLFPNNSNPLYSPFMYERSKALSLIVDLLIIAPVSFFPFLRVNKVGKIEKFLDVIVHHPKYLALPSVFWSLRWVSYLFMLYFLPKTFFKNIDIIHVEWIYPDAYAVVKLAKKKKIKTVGVVHGNESIEYYGKRKGNRKYQEVLSSLDRVIVVSRDLQHKLVTDYGVQPERINCIFNGVDVHRFALCDLVKSRLQLNLPIDITIGICVARLSEEKNIDILIQAISKLSILDFCMYIIGSGPLMDKMQRLIDSCGVADKVNLVGSIPHDQIATWLNASNFFCLPSNREGCPVVVHEALACGRPVIATAVGAIPDLVCSDEYGLLCSPGDIDGLAGSIERAVSKKWDHELIADYGRQFTWERMAAQTVNVYQEVLG